MLNPALLLVFDVENRLELAKHEPTVLQAFSRLGLLLSVCLHLSQPLLSREETARSRHGDGLEYFSFGRAHLTVRTGRAAAAVESFEGLGDASFVDCSKAAE